MAFKVTLTRFVSTLAGLSLCISASADDISWIQSGNGLWSDPNNWSSAVPGPTDTAVFDLPLVYDVTLDADPTTAGLEVSSGSVLLQSDATWRNYTLSGPGTINNAEFIITQMGMDVSPAGGLEPLVIGDTALGKLQVNQATLHTQGTSRLAVGAGSEGRVLVTGNAASWTVNGGDMYIGEGGFGVFGVTFGASVSGADNTFLRWNNTTHSEIIVRGAGTRYETTFLEVAHATQQFATRSSLLITDGGEVQATGMDLGGDAVISGPGSTLRVQDLEVNGFINLSSNPFWGVGGNVTVNNGAKVIVEPLVGAGTSVNLFEPAEVTLDGAGTQWIGRGIVMGNLFGALWYNDVWATLNIQNDAEMLLRSETGQETQYHNLKLQYTARVNLSSGRLVASEVRFDSTSFIDGEWRRGEFNFTGGTLTTGYFGYDMHNQGGVFDPGLDLGITEVFGDFTQEANATIKIELGGTTDSDYDRVSIRNNASLAGTLEVQLINGYVPNLGDMFAIIETQLGNLAGQFDNVLAPIVNGLTFDVIYNSQGVVLQVVEAPSILGDLDGDGFVGINDLNIVLGNWNQNVPPANPLADPSGDGFVGIDDLNAVLGNWNAGTPPGSTTANAVPEPVTAGILMLGGISLLHRRHTA